MQSFHERLRSSWQNSGSLLCVGIDPDLQLMPHAVRAAKKPFFEFGKAIVEATAAYVCAFKPQAAHFAAVGKEHELAELIAFMRANYPAIPIILDAKRGDVGSTARLYAKEAYERYNADAVTVNPETEMVDCSAVASAVSVQFPAGTVMVDVPIPVMVSVN